MLMGVNGLIIIGDKLIIKKLLIWVLLWLFDDVCCDFR